MLPDPPNGWIEKIIDTTTGEVINLVDHCS